MHVEVHTSGAASDPDLERIRAERQAQGLPRFIEDEALIEQAARIFDAADRCRDRAAS